MLKTRRFGYDGKGQVMVRDEADAASSLCGRSATAAILEAFVPFEREVSVVGGTRRATGGSSASI